MTKSIPPDQSPSDSSLPRPIEDEASPSSLLFPKSIIQDATSNLQLDDSWRQRSLRVLKGIFTPRTAVLGFIGLSAIYSFNIGRTRYTSVSEFVVQQPTPMNNSANTILGAGTAVPQAINSLLDGQYLKVYLASPDIKKKIYPEMRQLEML
ncbi:MAG: hypothetical protein VX481_07315, partial [Cyanobacteriota bacterium]|nr:hypothetical protein [Cyanobacteriota bacterium]